MKTIFLIKSEKPICKKDFQTMKNFYDIEFDYSCVKCNSSDESEVYSELIEKGIKVIGAYDEK